MSEYETDGIEPTLEQLLKWRPTRRKLIKLGLLTAVAADTAGGFAVERGMNHHPEADVYLNPDSDQTIIIGGGWANDGRVLGEMLAPVLGDFANIIAIKYADDNVDSTELHNLVFSTMRENGLRNPSWYLNSSAGLFLAGSMALHAHDPASQQEFGPTQIAVFHDSPHSEADLNNQGWFFANTRADALLKRSRVFNWLFGLGMRATLRGADFRDPAYVSYADAQAMKDGMAAADSITASAQMAGMRDINLPDGYLHGAARRFFFVHSEGESNDTNDSASALRGWRGTCGEVEEIIDPYAPANKHAPSTYPHILRTIFYTNLTERS